MIFLIKFKPGCKTEEITRNINNAFGPGTGNRCTVQWWFKTFCKGDKSFEDEGCSSELAEVDNSWEPSSKLILQPLHEKVPKSSMTTSGIRNKLKRWKSLISGYLMRCLGKKKEVSLRSVIFSYSRQRQQAISWLDYDMWQKWILHDNQRWPSLWLDGEEAPKHFPKSKLRQKNVMVTFWWSSPLWSTTAF